MNRKKSIMLSVDGLSQTPATTASSPL